MPEVRHVLTPTIAEMRGAPGQLVCGWYGLALANFGVLVNPTLEQFNRRWRAGDGAFAQVRVKGPRCRVSVDTFRAGPMPAVMVPLAELVVETSAERYLTAHPSASCALARGPVIYEATATRGDAVAAAVMLVELWWGNGDGAVRGLGSWITDLLNDGTLNAAQDRRVRENKTRLGEATSALRAHRPQTGEPSGAAARAANSSASSQRSIPAMADKAVARQPIRGRDRVR